MPFLDGTDQHNLFWLSFVDKNMPEGSRTLGVIITKAKDFGAAVQKAHHLKINPGGEVIGFSMPSGIVNKRDYDRLLQPEYLLEKGYI